MMKDDIRPYLVSSSSFFCMLKSISEELGSHCS